MLIFSIDLKASQIKAPFGMCLPMVILARWSDNLDPALLLTKHSCKIVLNYPASQMLRNTVKKFESSRLAPQFMA
jgi:hypothetical protein